MKKIIFIAFAAILAGFAISCQKEELVSEKTDAVQYTFNITVNELTGFDNDASTKEGSPASYKSKWDEGDRIFLFFKPANGSLLTDTYATLTYNGSAWGGSVYGPTSLGVEGTLSAVYVYKLGSDVEPEYSDTDGQWTIPTGNVFYNCQIGVGYSVSGSEISATLNLKAPDDFVRFTIYGTTGNTLTCNTVKGWNDVVIGSEMTFSNATCTGYMTGFENSGNPMYQDFYGRIVSGNSLNGKDCEFSVVKDGKVYEHTATPETDARSFSMGINNWIEVPENSLTCRFTVSDPDDTPNSGDEKKIYFSKGNLVATIDATGAPTAWKFATNQYDYLGEGGANKTIGTAAGDVDLFGWSTNATLNNWGIYISSDDDYTSGNFNDWGVAYCESKSITAGTWRTLSLAEWQYLFAWTSDGANKDTGSPRYNLHKYGVAVCGKTNCVVLLPDYWVWDENTVGTSWQTAYPETADDSHPVTWQAMEAAGAVCLPAAGGRVNTTPLTIQSGIGLYWSSFPYSNTQAYDVYFYDSDVSISDAIDRSYGLSVRLVTDIK